MALRTKSTLTIGTAVLAALTLSGCATEDYVDEHIATVNQRIDAVEGEVRRVDQSAQQANAAAQQANTAAQAAAASAQRANQGVDQLTSRVTAMEQAQRRPRN